MAAKRKEPTQNDLDIQKYEKEIAYWQEKYDKANKNHDWDARNWAGCQLYVKRDALERLKSKVRSKIK